MNSDYQKSYYQKNRAKIIARTKQYRLDNLEEVNAKAAIRRANPENKNKHAAYAKQWELDNKQKSVTNRKRWESENKDRVTASKTKYRDNNRDRVRKSAREYVGRRRDADDNYRLRSALRSRIHAALNSKGVRKLSRTELLLGCTIQFLRGYLEARFQPGMTWENYGTWHVDHIMPCDAYDLRDTAQQMACFNYKNLQPLWGSENVRKGAKRPLTHQAELLCQFH